MRHSLFCLCTLLFVLFSSNLLYSQKEINKSDSISLSIAGLGKKERLTALLKLADVKDIISIERLEKEAAEQNNHLGLSHAYFLKQQYYQFVDVANDSLVPHYRDLAISELKIAEREKDKLDKDDIHFYQNVKKNIIYGIVSKYLAENKYELALFYLNGLLGDSKYEEDTPLEYDSYALLGVCYIYVGKYQEAFDNLTNAYKVYDRYTGHKAPYEYCRFFEGLLHALEKLKDYKQMIVLSDSLENMIIREYDNTKSKAYPYHVAKFIAKNSSAYASIKLGDLFQARKKLDTAREIILKEFPGSVFTCKYYEVEIQYHLAVKNDNKAREYLDLYLECVNSKNEFQGLFYYLETHLVKADVLHKSGDDRSAYELLSELYQLNDSITARNFSDQLAEIQTLYKVDRMKLESERDKMKLKEARNMLLGAIVVFIFLSFIIYMIWKNGKVLKEKNRQLYIKYSEIERNNEKIKELQSQRNNDVSEENGEIDTSDSLIYKLERYLLETQIYLSPELTREDLALEMGTNRQYLIEAIKEKTGKTYNEYIYSYRLRYAYNEIVNNKNKSIADICYESGFASRGPFNRNFKEVYGMTPSELREVLPK